MPKPEQTNQLPEGDRLQMNDYTSFTRFKEHIVATMRSDPKMCLAISTILEQRFPEELQDNCDLDDNMWIRAPGATDPSNPNARTTTHLTARDLKPTDDDETDDTAENTHARAGKSAYRAAVAAGTPDKTAREIGKRTYEELKKTPNNQHSPTKRPKTATQSPTYVSPLKRRPESATTSQYAKTYNKTVDTIAAHQIADFFGSIPPIIGLIQNNLSPPVYQALAHDPDWKDAIRRRDLVRA